MIVFLLISKIHYNDVKSKYIFKFTLNLPISSDPSISYTTKDENVSLTVIHPNTEIVI
jgi:hypothetical protein